jgi:hypothetical protein
MPCLSGRKRDKSPLIRLYDGLSGPSLCFCTPVPSGVSMVYWIVREQPLMRPPGGWADLPQDILYIQPVFLVGLNGAETPETAVYANLISVESSRLGSDGNEDLSDLYCSDFIQFGDLVLFRLGDHIVWRPEWSATLLGEFTDAAAAQASISFSLPPLAGNHHESRTVERASPA